MKLTCAAKASLGSICDKLLIRILLGTWFVLTLWQEGLVLIYALF
jgi:hypothetical protein